MPKFTRKQLIEDQSVDIIDQNTKKRIKSIFPKSVQVGIPSDSEFNQSSITINNYTFPNTDGTDQQVISTDGNGNLYWGSVSGEPGPQGETGPTGATGADGESGSGVTINLNPGSVLLIANSTGTVSDYTPSGATIEVYENGVQLGIHNIATPDNSSFKIGTLSGTSITPGSVTQTSGSLQATVSDASSMTQDTASITHPVTVKNKFGTSTTYDVIQTLAKAKQGADGADGRDGTSGSAVAVYKINSVNTQITSTSSGDYVIPYDTAVIENSNVVSSNSSGTFTLNSSASSVFKITVYTLCVRKSGTEGSDKFRLQVEGKTAGAASFTEIFDGLKQTVDNADTQNFEFVNTTTYLSTTGESGQLRIVMVRDSNTGPAYLQTVSAADCTVTIEKF